MKKILFILLAMALTMGAVGQTVVKGNYQAFAGATADTLTASVTKSYVLDLGSTGGWAGKVYDCTIEVWNDYQSDSLTYGYKIYRSNDGVNWPRTAVDSVTAVTTKGVADKNFQAALTAQTARFLKVSLIATSQTQKSNIYGYIYVNKHD